MTDITPAEKDGKYKFSISYAERELDCLVEKTQNILHVSIGDAIKAELAIQNDGLVVQTAGTDLPASTIEYIRKKILG